MSRPALRGTGLAALLLGLAAAPFLVDEYAIQTMSRILVFGLLAMSVNLLTGVTGLPTLGQSAYFGVGAYTAAIVSTSLTDIGVVQLLVAGALTAAVALPTGWVAVRARGVAFLMITLAIGEIAFSAAVRWKDVTRGTDGYSGIPAVLPLPGMPSLQLDGLVSYGVLAVFLVLFVRVRLLVASPFGLALRGIRDNEARMRAIGYPTTGFALAGYCVA
jgi:branched-chain amino acid transport system permease protein